MGQRYSKTTALLAGKFLDAQEDNINLHNYLNARKKWGYLALCANKTVPEAYCFKIIALGCICQEQQGLNSLN